VLDPAACYKALETKDDRFDGRIFVGVTSTGIYCRPVCPAGPPKFKHCRFFPSAAAAQDAGFRPCLRCRPETAIDLGSWRGTSNTVSRGLALIAEGELDRDDASIDTLAERLGVGARQLRRLFQQHLGASPIVVAQTRRVLFAKQLVHETHLPMAEIALAAGFGSVRRFNETFQALFGKPPSALRKKTHKRDTVTAGVSVRLRYRAPYDWDAMLAYLRDRAVPGVERVDELTYARTAVHDGAVGTVEITHAPLAKSLVATIRFPSVRALPSMIARIRRVFDLGADVTAIGAHLSRDPMLRRLIAARPGLRAPGGWDGFELAARAVLGQQVTVEAGRQLVSQLVALAGAKVSATAADLTRTFPSAVEVTRADLGAMRMPGARKQTLVALARAAVDDPTLFQARESVEDTVARLSAIKGIGDWTAHYIALRAAREPDAFPASDVGLLRGATEVGGVRPSPRELLERAEPWRPWRAYAAQHLWTAHGAHPATP
jgi:AraC family transcriptional regulator of adaptative response / DNA-3-methyladenine glycosylase II